jgi:hypothetical protein
VRLIVFKIFSGRGGPDACIFSFYTLADFRGRELIDKSGMFIDIAVHYLPFDAFLADAEGDFIAVIEIFLHAGLDISVYFAFLESVLIFEFVVFSGNLQRFLVHLADDDA